MEVSGNDVERAELKADVGAEAGVVRAEVREDDTFKEDGVDGFGGAVSIALATCDAKSEV